jgi:phage baseplate assembly protein W
MTYTDISPKLNTEPLKNEDAIMASMGNILATPTGSVPGHPEFGCGMDKYLFEQIDLLTVQMIKEEVQYALARWEPRIKVLDVEVKEDLDYNRIDIKVIFSILNEPDNPERDYIHSVNV